MPGTPHEGGWKLIESLEDNRLQLFNLKEDRGEKNDLALGMPEKAQELHRMLEEWRKDTAVQMPKVNPDFNPQ